MDRTLQTVGFGKVGNLFPGEQVTRLGNDFFIADVRDDGIFRLPEAPFRFDGYVAVLCLEGSVDLDINLQPCHVDPNSLLFCGPDQVIRFVGKSRRGGVGIHCIVTGVSEELVSGTRGDYNRLFLEGMKMLTPTAIPLNGEEVAVYRKYLSLAADVAGMDIRHRKEVVAPLVASCSRLLDAAVRRRVSGLQEGNSPAPDRTQLLFERFIRLVTEFHGTERGVAFYAEKLGLTPKYLSRLVRQASGRSAPDWIDSFVILDAKNLLKNTSSTVKEIVWSLHFPSQSVFCKFFKHHTGMTPSEYRNS